MALHRKGFLSNGPTLVGFKAGGITQLCEDKFGILVIVDNITSRHSLTSEEGIGSLFIA